MLWLRNSVVCLLSVWVAACHFTPIYRQGGQRDALTAVAVTSPDTREGQLLKAQLEDLIAPEGNPAPTRYRLDPNLQIAIEPLSIDADGTTRRYRLIGIANYQLIDNATQQPLTKGSLQRFSSYHIARADYSTYVAGMDARKQVIGAIAEELRLRLIEYFAKHSDENQAQ